MAGASGGALAAQVTIGGGFGFVAPTYDGPAKFTNQINIARSALNIPSGPLPIGVGFLAWRLEKPKSSDVELLAIALQNQVQAIWFACGEDTLRWIEFVREFDKKTGQGQKTQIFVQVGTLDQALVAVRDWKVDVLVAQGNESGGHGYAAAPSLVTLLSQITTALSKETAPPLLAAGGIMNGSQAAAYLTLGAGGAVLGTRFLLTPEAQCPEPRKHAILTAKTDSSVRSGVFDVVNNTLGWPAGVDGRGLRIPAVQKVADGADIGDVKKEFADGAQKGDPQAMVIYAGTGVGLVKEVKPAKDIVHELHDEIIERLQAASHLVPYKTSSL
ncbi:hypothetical protein EWM64_g5947 [Hericium alpestre]|uniref:Uncharacterized protein n=1 Tax=Hericium alpestre TaxID=135208 RepID=A0A4Y9ZVI5_9AGAM|nr:hypothetical protein EWM64_g5947 [Hericium alpestre]